MPSIATFRKQAKLLVRWHRERNHSLGGRIRQIERYRHLTDAEVLDAPFTLIMAQEVIALEADYPNWAALRTGLTSREPESEAVDEVAVVKAAVPILFVDDVAHAAHFYAEKLGFAVDFLHGNPPFYGSVSRGRSRLHLRFVHQPNFVELAGREESLILATIEVANVKALFDEFAARDVDFPQRLVRQAWGGLDFHVRDPAGNIISFVEYMGPARATARP